MADDASLVAVLEEARDLGFLGPGPVTAHLDHARAYLPALPRRGTPGVVMDLGTGGGVPGLPLAAWRDDLRWVLVDAMQKRAAFVDRAASQLGLGVEVVLGRAEALGRDSALRGTVDVVVSRSLAAPAVAAEYAAPFLVVGGRAVVAEPPGGDPQRWSRGGLARLGMRTGPVLFAATATLQVLEQAEVCPAEFPRRVGVAAKRPLF